MTLPKMTRPQDHPLREPAFDWQQVPSLQAVVLEHFRNMAAEPNQERLEPS